MGSRSIATRSIEHLGLTAFTCRVLREAGIERVGQLVEIWSWSTDWWAEKRGYRPLIYRIGPKRWEKIKEKLVESGFTDPAAHITPGSPIAHLGLNPRSYMMLWIHDVRRVGQVVKIWAKSLKCWQIGEEGMWPPIPGVSFEQWEEIKARLLEHGFTDPTTDVTLDSPLAHLGLRGGIYRAFWEAGVRWVGEVVAVRAGSQKDESYLSWFPGIGKEEWEEIEEELRAHGFSVSELGPSMGDVRIECLGLETRWRNALRRAGIYWVGDLLDRFEEGGDKAILEIQQIGVEGLAHIKQTLRLQGSLFHRRKSRATRTQRDRHGSRAFYDLNIGRLVQQGTLGG